MSANDRESVQTVLTREARKLEAAGIDDALRDARRLMTAALEIGSDRLTLHVQEIIGADARRTFEAYCARRADREPVSRILGGRLFYGRWFKNAPYVLDPRPETECLIALALDRDFEAVLDIGTGSGCIALTLLAERPNSSAVATDISEQALEIAKKNADVLDVSARVSFGISNWFDAVTGQFDLIVSNPPYIHPDEIAGLAPEVAKRDPFIALSDGLDGLTAYREIATHALSHLTPGGRVLVEIGPTQGADVSALFSEAGLGNVAVHPDLDGRDRNVEGFAPVD